MPYTMDATSYADFLVNTLRELLPKSNGPVVLHEPKFQGNEWQYVKDCLDTGWVSSAGKYVERFEKQLAEFTDMPHAIATVNGTAALHMCLKLAGVKSQDEVLIPALTFVATANAVTYCGAMPHLVDSEERTLGIDAVALAEYLKDIAHVREGVCTNRYTGRVIRAVVVMHTFGCPADLDPLLALCEQYHLTLIEDAAESLGSYYKNQHTGHHGLLTALSFNGNKVVTTGGGGAILTQDAGLAKRAKHLTTTAKATHDWAFYHDEAGYNYRLPNINAALGCAQLEQLPAWLTQKQQLAKRYKQAFDGLDWVACFQAPGFAVNNYWLNALVLAPTHTFLRDLLLAATHQAGFMTRPAWNLMHTLPMYQDCPRMPLSCAEQLQKRIINLPSSPHLAVMANL